VKIISVNVGMPKQVVDQDRVVVTGIYKSPVTGRVPVRRLGLEGDGQADLTVHGGPEKAVYVYPTEHYAFWRETLPDAELAWGAFGENVDTEGLLEDGVHVGDVLRVGSATLRPISPRLPCSKLAMKFGDPGMIQRFLRSGRTGFYLAVDEEGDVGAGDPIRVLHRDPDAFSIAELTRLHASGRDDPEGLRRAIEVRALSEGWRERFRRRLGDR
jgi:MOSC domain-containing protein YiiM